MSIEVGWDSLVWNKDKNLDQEVPYWITLQKKKNNGGILACKSDMEM